MSTASSSEAAAPWLPAALNRGWTYRDRIGASDAGRSVLAYYTRRYPHSSASVWRRRLAGGEIVRGGREILSGDERLACNDRLSWQRPPWWEASVPDLGPCLHDDGDLYVLDKPSGLPVLPAGGWLEHTLLRLLERRHRGDPAGVPRPVHRLGRFTSGLLICARRRATRAWLSAALRESTRSPVRLGSSERAGWLARATVAPPDDPQAACPAGVPKVRKLYRALLQPGALALQPASSLVINTPIGRRPHARLAAIWCAAQTPEAGDLLAHSVLTLLERSAEADLVVVAIGSGRPHQIRIHCAAVGAPLLGDPLYRPGGQADPDALPGDGGYHLQAWRLELQRPDGEPLVLEVPRALGFDALEAGP